MSVKRPNRSWCWQATWDSIDLHQPRHGSCPAHDSHPEARGLSLAQSTCENHLRRLTTVLPLPGGYIWKGQTFCNTPCRATFPRHRVCATCRKCEMEVGEWVYKTETRKQKQSAIRRRARPWTERKRGTWTVELGARHPPQLSRIWDCFEAPSGRLVPHQWLLSWSSSASPTLPGALTSAPRPPAEDGPQQPSAGGFHPLRCGCAPWFCLVVAPG